jgi:hypothetical protein
MCTVAVRTPCKIILFEKAVLHNRIFAGGRRATGVALDEELDPLLLRNAAAGRVRRANAAAPALCGVWQRCALRCCFREGEPVTSNLKASKHTPVTLQQAQFFFVYFPQHVLPDIRLESVNCHHLVNAFE